MKNKILMGLSIIVMIVTLSSCGKTPQVQIDATKAAIDSAVVAEAPIYLPVEFLALQDSMNVILTDVATQQSKLFKKFGPIKVKLDSTLVIANKLTVSAGIKKAEVKKEVETLLAEVKVISAENVVLLTKAPRGKEGVVVLEQIRTEMTTIEATVLEAQGMYDRGLFMDANSKIKAGKELATGINTELKDAIAKVKR